MLRMEELFFGGEEGGLLDPLHPISLLLYLQKALQETIYSSLSCNTKETLNKQNLSNNWNKHVFYLS